MSAGTCLDQLLGNTNPVACLAHAAFDYELHTQLFTNFSYIKGLPLEGK